MLSLRLVFIIVAIVFVWIWITVWQHREMMKILAAKDDNCKLYNDYYKRQVNELRQRLEDLGQNPDELRFYHHDGVDK